jgi:hypothetical protein
MNVCDCFIVVNVVLNLCIHNIIFTEQFIIIYKSNKVYFLILFFLFSHIDLISSTLCIFTSSCRNNQSLAFPCFNKDKMENHESIT